MDIPEKLDNQTLIDNQILITLACMHDMLDRTDLNECREGLQKALRNLEYIWIDEA